MVRILSEPKNALMRQYQKLFELDKCKAGIHPGGLEEIAQLAVDRKIGARGLRSILESVMMDLMYEIPSDDSIGICTHYQRRSEKGRTAGISIPRYASCIWPEAVVRTAQRGQ